MMKHWSDLVSAYKTMDIEFPNLKKVTLAMWAFQSEFGQEPLAINALNFSSLKWDADLEKIIPGTYKMNYGSHNGKELLYFQFDSVETFIKTFWRSLDKLPVPHWKEQVKTMTVEWDFLELICHSGYMKGSYDHHDWFIRNVIKTFIEHETDLSI